MLRIELWNNWVEFDRYVLPWVHLFGFRLDESALFPSPFSNSISTQPLISPTKNTIEWHIQSQLSSPITVCNQLSDIWLPLNIAFPPDRYLIWTAHSINGHHINSMEYSMKDAMFRTTSSIHGIFSAWDEWDRVFITMPFPVCDCSALFWQTILRRMRNDIIVIIFLFSLSRFSSPPCWFHVNLPVGKECSAPQIHWISPPNICHWQCHEGPNPTAPVLLNRCQMLLFKKCPASEKYWISLQYHRRCTHHPIRCQMSHILVPN